MKREIRFIIFPVLIIIPIILFLGFILWALFRAPEKNNDSRYAKSHNYMDFDQGIDSGKVGDPRYPKAGIDSVMKEDFLDNFDKSK